MQRSPSPHRIARPSASPRGTRTVSPASKRRGTSSTSGREGSALPAWRTTTGPLALSTSIAERNFLSCGACAGHGRADPVRVAVVAQVIPQVVSLDRFHLPALRQEVVITARFFRRPGVCLVVVAAIRDHQVDPAGDLVQFLPREALSLVAVAEQLHQPTRGRAGRIGRQHGRGRLG